LVTSSEKHREAAKQANFSSIKKHHFCSKNSKIVKSALRSNVFQKIFLAFEFDSSATLPTSAQILIMWRHITAETCCLALSLQYL